MISYYIKKLFSISFLRKIPQLLLSKFGLRVRERIVEENFSNSFRKSYSQCGEDLIIEYIFYLRGILKPTFLDIGANDPFVINNTALFYQLGSKGVNIEANPDLINKLTNSRPRDITLNVGIGLMETEMNFYIMEDHTLSTFSESEYLQMLKSGKTLSKIKRVRVLTLQSIIDKYFNGTFPDLLCIDVEGLDFDILKSLNFEKSIPKVICVEAAEYSPIGAGKCKDELINFLVSKGYYEYANTNLNAIMVKSDFWFI